MDQDQVVDKKVRLQLVGLDGNAYCLMGAFSRCARHQDWTKEEIDKVMTEAKASDYSHLVSTLAAHCENPVDDNEFDGEEGD